MVNKKSMVVDQAWEGAGSADYDRDESYLTG